MNTDPTESLAPKASPSTEKSNRTPSLPSELADVSLRQLLGMLLSSTGLAERHAYLQRTPQDKPNGFYDRSLQLGAIPVDLQVPRTRSGAFRPATLPPLYQRGYSQESQSLLLSLLASARSLNAVKDALHKMGLSSSPQELEPVATELIEELDLRNSRPLEPDDAMAKNKFSPAGHVRDAKISRIGSLSCATCSNAACDACCWCRTTFPDCSPSPKASCPTPTFSSVSCRCSATPKPISANQIPPSFNSPGAPSKHPGISRSLISSSNSSANALLKTIPLSLPSYAKNASLTWPSCSTRK